MQTFLPYASFIASAQVLDNARLGKQRVECLQIMRTLTGRSNGWRSHPAVSMWIGHVWALGQYGEIVCDEWTRRGFSDTCRGQITAMKHQAFDKNVGLTPWWLGWEDFHRSHRSNLIRKDRIRYAHFWPDVPDNLPYVWPKISIHVPAWTNLL